MDGVLHYKQTAKEGTVILVLILVYLLYHSCIFLAVIIIYWLFSKKKRGAKFPRVFRGCQIPWGDGIFPREFGMGVPNSLGCQIPCDTGTGSVPNYPVFRITPRLTLLLKLRDTVTTLMEA